MFNKINKLSILSSATTLIFGLVLLVQPNPAQVKQSEKLPEKLPSGDGLFHFIHTSKMIMLNHL